LHMCRHPITVKEKIYIQNYTYFKLQLILGSHHFDHIKWLMSDIHYINCQNPLNKPCIYAKFYTQWFVTLILYVVLYCIVLTVQLSLNSGSVKCEFHNCNCNVGSLLINFI
jgi:hypothetical protein